MALNKFERDKNYKTNLSNAKYVLFNLFSTDHQTNDFCWSHALATYDVDKDVQKVQG